jgi:hypothetical protein
MNSLFSGGHQQDAHELLRCTLSYVQDSVKLLNNHRLALSAAVKTDKQEHSAKNNEINVSAPNSRKSEGDSSSTNTEKKAKRRRSSSSMSESTETCGSSSVARITNFFVRAGPKPKSVSDIPVKTHVLLDLVEDGFEGVVERKTRCLECERVTKCNEVFQDVEVVVQKNGTKAGVKENHDAGISTIVFPHVCSCKPFLCSLQGRRCVMVVLCENQCSGKQNLEHNCSDSI